MARASNLTTCSFCGTSHERTRKLVAGPGVNICDSCINICKGLVDNGLSEDAQRESAIRFRKPDIRRTFIFRYNKRYKIEITLGLYQCLVSNTTIIKQMEALGFCHVNVVGAGRNRTVEGTWLHDNTTLTIRSIEGKIETKSEYPLAALLEGLGDAKELQPSKQISSKAKRSTGRSRRRS